MESHLSDRRFRNLAVKFQDGTASTEERQAFEKTYALLSTRHEVWDESLMGAEAEVKGRIRLVLEVELRNLNEQKRKFTLYKYLSVAMLLLSLATGFYLYKSGNTNELVKAKPCTILPGGNKAVLTLANGEKIVLTDAKNGELAQQSGIRISKLMDGTIVYEIAGQAKTRGAEAWNTIETPRGGQYQIILPDGSHVWLNAASSLRYPAKFTGKTREVELSGEAYFEVAHNARQPFIVGSIAADRKTRQRIVVLGTHFNVNAYTDEPVIKSTLLQGAITVSSTGNGKIILKPGQQSAINAKGTLLSNVDVDDVVAWKNGYFLFNDENLASVMRKISRWYNVDVEFKNAELQAELFSGTVSRYKNISQVLRVIELTQAARFTISGNRVIISERKTKL